jgi:hypothetical protein
MLNWLTAQKSALNQLRLAREEIIFHSKSLMVAIIWRILINLLLSEIALGSKRNQNGIALIIRGERSNIVFFRHLCTI